LEISVVIATHDRPQSLARLLASLAPQIVAGEHEMLIADNGTPQPSPLSPEITVACHLHDPMPGKTRMQNRAIAKAQGRIVACVDDDVVTAPDYLTAVKRFFDSNPQFAAMKGRVLAANDPGTVAGDNAIYLDLPIVDHGEEVCEVRGVVGANMAFRAQALAQVGLFNERLGPGASGWDEETEISARLRAAGFRIGYCPYAIVYHEVNPARADRARFLRVARERGYCRMLHERHHPVDVLTRVTLAALRLGMARALHAPASRVAREDSRLATALGMLDGLRQRRAN